MALQPNSFQMLSFYLTNSNLYAHLELLIIDDVTIVRNTADPYTTRAVNRLQIVHKRKLDGKYYVSVVVYYNAFRQLSTWSATRGIKVVSHQQQNTTLLCIYY